jgi:hypothetical protein
MGTQLSQQMRGVSACRAGQEEVEEQRDRFNPTLSIRNELRGILNRVIGAIQLLFDVMADVDHSP